VQSSLIHDVRAAVAENANNGVGVARGNVTRCGHDVTSHRAAAATANTRDELNASISSSGTSRNPRDAVSNAHGNQSYTVRRIHAVATYVSRNVSKKFFTLAT